MGEVVAMTRYLRFFAFFGVPFSLLLGLNHSPFFHVGKFLDGVLEGLLFAAFVAVVDAWMTRATRRRLNAKGIAFTNMNPRQERHLQLSTSPSIALQACVRVVKDMPKMKIVAIDSATGSVTADTVMSWRSVGERIIVEVRPDGGGSRIRITSAPFLPIAFLDGGKGAENVGTLLRELTAA
jgi:hypothetical protein